MEAATASKLEIQPQELGVKVDQESHINLLMVQALTIGACKPRWLELYGLIPRRQTAPAKEEHA